MIIELNDILPLFQRLLEERVGLVYSKHDPGMLTVGIGERCRALGCKDEAEYLDILKNPLYGERELKALLDIITIKETSFFRNADHFRILRERVVPELFEKKRPSDRQGGSRRPTIKIWSAGCATGEEAYSLAILFMYMGAIEKGFDVKIYATDVSPRALEYGMKGIYPAESVSHLPAMVKERFFERRGEFYSVIDEVKSHVSFEEYNVTSTSLPGWAYNFDIIFCQNVLIYLSPRGCSQCLKNLYKALSDDGYLFLGFSEGALARKSSFCTVDIDGVFICRKQRDEAEKCDSEAKGYNRRTTISRGSGETGDERTTGSVLRSKERLKFHVFRDIIVPGKASSEGGQLQGEAVSEEGVQARPAATSSPSGMEPSRAEGLSQLSRRTGQGKAGEGSQLDPGVFCFQLEYFITISDIPEIERLIEIGIDTLYYDPNVRDMVDRGIQTLLNLQCYEEVEEFCTKIMEIDPLRPYPYRAMGLVYYGRGRYAKAEEYLKKALYLAPDNLLAHLYLGIIAERRGSIRRFKAEMSHILKLLSSGASVDPHSGLSTDELISFCREKLQGDGKDLQVKNF